jgi:CheY-like chemotaxis protein
MKKHKVMIVDDDDAFLEETADMLEDGGYEVQIAATPFQAIAAIAKGTPDIILLDARMEENGVSFAKMLQSDDKTSHIPIVVVSASKKEDISGDFVGADIREFIKKPVNPLDLIAAIETHVNKA